MPLRKVTNAELALLDRLWERGKATIRELTDELYPGGGTAQYATVQKLLERLEAKGYVRRDRSRRAHVFRARIGRQEFLTAVFQDLAQKVCGGSVTPLFASLLATARLSREERRSVRLLVDEFFKEERGGKAKKKRKKR